MLQNLCDTHTHTMFSRHAYSTIRENVLAAHDAGLDLLASTDHFGNMLFTSNDCREFQFFNNYGTWPRNWAGVKLMRGLEADIVDLEGHLYAWDVPVEYNITLDKLKHPTNLLNRTIKDCDYVIASIHAKDFTTEATRAQMTEMYIKALNHRKVLMLGHIGRSNLDVEFRPIVEEAARLNKLIEINEHSFDMGKFADRCIEVAKLCMGLGCKVAVNTDAHICTRIAQTPRALAMLESVDFPQELIATTSAETFLASYYAALGNEAIQIDFDEEMSA